MNEKQVNRRAGILMPVSSLPSDCGIGTLGKGAYDFIDWLHSAGMKIWQVLPLLPTGFGDSPYQSCASNALNPYFIDFALLVEGGLLEKSDYLDLEWCEDIRRVDYGRQFSQKCEVLKKAFARFDKTDGAWQAFLAEGDYQDYALFMALKVAHNYAPWTEWETPYKNCEAGALESFSKQNKEEIEFWQFTQYLFIRQWKDVLAYAHAKGVSIMGDMPIYVSEDSVETWKYRRDLFMLNEEGDLSMRAGVPPDAFSEDGQFWGNPVYDWDKLKQSDYAWWDKRFQNAFSLFDIVRIDHFRAFDRFFAIPAGAESAKDGAWMDGPKAELFAALSQSYDIVAEDLGIIDDGVRRLMQDTGFPGMKVFAFAFDGNLDNEYLPHNIDNENCVVYTGTHDNETLCSFLENMDAQARKVFEKQFEKECLEADTPYRVESIEVECASIIELLFSTKADTVIVPMQDVLAFGEEARLNAPSTVSQQNWTFRFVEKDFGRRRAAWLKALTKAYNR